MAWTAQVARPIRDMFDAQATDWENRDHTGRTDIIRDAVRRGGPLPHGPCLDVGGGTGLLTPLLRDVFDNVATIDLSPEMLRHAPARGAALIQADAGRLPFTDDCAACTVVMDSVFFTAEIRRVLRPDGVIIWATRLGAAAPFHLPVDVILQALGPGWTATAAQAGWGEWAVIRQSRLGHHSDSRARTTPQSPVSELHSPPSA